MASTGSDRTGGTVALSGLADGPHIFTVAALALAGLPLFAGSAGHGWIEASAQAHGLAWITAVMLVCTVLAGGTVLRVAGGVFYGLGDPPREDPQMAEEAAEETSETDEAKQRTPLTMVIPPAVLLAIALGTGVLGVLGKLGPVVQAMAVRFEDHFRPRKTENALPPNREPGLSGEGRSFQGLPSGQIPGGKAVPIKMP